MMLMGLGVGVFVAAIALAPPVDQPAAGRVEGRDIRVPAGFLGTIYAEPPEVRYPTCLASAPDGTLFVGIDENGSLDRGPGRGRVVRCRDLDGDGRGDEFVDFVADVDSPRGLAWDGRELFVLHPPHLDAWRDDDGDGHADRHRRLIEGIGFDLGFRGADHTTNGIRLAIDGWIYIAVGDYGFRQARGADGMTRTLRGGGVVRVRPDGSGLEVVTRGQRNIYDVAVSPLLDRFTRDNTNDGDGWDVRLSHVVDLAHYGYPSLYRNFSEEAMPPLADLGGGSPTGSLWVQEPTLPEPFNNTLLTCEWGRSQVIRHSTPARGAGFAQEEHEFLRMQRPTDIDVDASGRFYVTSWEGGKFKYDGPEIGYLLEVRPDGWAPVELPDLGRADIPRLLDEVRSPGATRRLFAQRELLRRPPTDEIRGDLLATAADREAMLEVRVSALFTARLAGASADTLMDLTGDAALRRFVLRALADDGPRRGEGVATDLYTDALIDPDPTVRREALIGLARLERVEAAGEVFDASLDPDPVLEHTARKAFVHLDDPRPALAALSSTEPTRFRAALAALREMHETGVVDGLVAALETTKDRPRRMALLTVLVRLYHREDTWATGWWGTRPDTTGPYYDRGTWAESPRIGGVIQAELSGDDEAITKALLVQLLRHRVEIEGWREILAGRAEGDGEGDRAAELLGQVAADPGESGEARTQALRGLMTLAEEPGVLPSLIEAMTSFDGLGDDVSPSLWRAREDYVRERRRIGDADDFAALTDADDPARRALAYAVLLGIRNTKNPKPALLARIDDLVDHGRSDERCLPSLLRGIAYAGDKTTAGLVLAATEDPSPAVRDTARRVVDRLGISDPRLLEVQGVGPKGPRIGELDPAEVIAAAVREPGNPGLGAALFDRQGCVTCHTVRAGDPPIGPYLGDIAGRYARADLAESILKPSARLAQGFETQVIATVDGLIRTGFVVRESGDALLLRDGEGREIVIPRVDLDERKTSDVSVMPEGLVKDLSPADLASLLAYLESLSKRAPSAP